MKNQNKTPGDYGTSTVQNQFLKKLRETQAEEIERARIEADNTFFSGLPLIKKMSARKCLAIDISTHHIKYLIYKKSGTAVHVLKSGVEEIPTDGANRYRSLELSLKYLRSRFYKKSMDVQVTFFSPDINIRPMVLPNLKPDELKNSILYKNKTDLPNFSENDYWRYQVLETYTENDVEKCKVLVTVAPAELVDFHMDVLLKSGIKPSYLIPKPFSFSAAYRQMVRLKGNDVLVDIEDDITQICFFADGKLQYVRNFAIGANNLKKAIASSGSGPESVAGNGDNGAGEKSNADPAQSIRERLQNQVKSLKNKQNPLLQVLMSEINRSLEFFKSGNNQVEMNNLFISGQGLKIEAVFPYIKNRLQHPVYALVPKFESDLDDDTSFSEYTAVLGAALFSEKELNMVPKEYRTREIFRNLNVLVTFLILLTAGWGSFSFWYKAKELHDYSRLSVETQKNYYRLNPVEVQYHETLQQIGALDHERSQLLKMVTPDPELLRTLKLFSNEVPANIRLTELQFAPAPKEIPPDGQTTDPEAYRFQVEIIGQVTGDYLNGDVILINFMNHLENLRHFKKLKLQKKTKQIENKLYEFEIEGFL